MYLQYPASFQCGNQGPSPLPLSPYLMLQSRSKSWDAEATSPPLATGATLPEDNIAVRFGPCLSVYFVTQRCLRPFQQTNNNNQETIPLLPDQWSWTCGPILRFISGKNICFHFLRLLVSRVNDIWPYGSEQEWWDQHAGQLTGVGVGAGKKKYWNAPLSTWNVKSLGWHPDRCC